MRVGATVGLALITLATDHLATQGRRTGRSLRTVIVDGHEAVDGEVIVRYRANAGAIGRQRAEFEVDSEETESVGRRGARRMRSRRLATRTMLQLLRNNPDIEYAEPNYVIRLAAMPNDPSFLNLWGLFNSGQTINGASGVAAADINAPNAWQVTTGSRAHVVGVIDTGVDYTHPDLASNMWTAPRPFTVTIGGVSITCAAGTHGFNAITNSCNPMDDHSHGTHVAGTIGATGNNGVGVAGVNWVGSTMALKFLGASGSGSTSDAIKAIEFAIQAKAALGADANVRVLNNSWGGGGYSTALANQIEAANSADMLFVAAAGNNSVNTDLYPHYPSSYSNSNVVSVASSTNRDQRSSFSNYGVSSVDLFAPGSSVLSTVPGNSYAYYNGTSMATPHVAGAAALVLAACPVSTAVLKNVLLTTVDMPAALSGLSATGGRLDVNNAIAQCLADLEPPALVVNTPLVEPGGTVTFQALHGPGNRMDWIGFYGSGGEDRAYQQWQFLNGTQTPPALGNRNATLQFRAPPTPGSYDIRWFANGGYTKLATSSTITVAATPKLTINDVSVTEGHSGTATATFTVSVSPINPSQTVTVSYATANGTATATDGDYVAAAGTLTFAPSASTQTISVTIKGDASIEDTETFFVNLSGAINATIADGQGSGTIVTDDIPPCTTCPLVTASPASVAPGAPITVQLLNGPANPLDWLGLYAAASTEDRGLYLQWQFMNGTQTAPASGRSNATLVFTAPQTPGTYDVRWFANGGYTKLGTSGTITVGTPSPALRIGDASVVEGNSGTRNATFTVTLSPVNASQSVTVQYSTANGSAVAGSDYTAVTGTLTFAPSVATQTVTVPVVGDTVVESDETFTIGLSGAANALIADASGVGTIVNDDAATCSTCPAITVPTRANPGAPISVQVVNGPGNAMDWIGLYAEGAEDRGNYLQWQFLNGSQSPPAVGRSTATVSFTVPASPGTYNIRLFANGGYTKLATSDTLTVGTPSPTISIGDVSINEGNAGSAAATFTVTIAPVNTAQTVTVDYAAADGTATTANSDYTAVSGTLTFAPSVATQTITVPIIGDTTVEPNETFTVALSNAANATIGDGQGVGTIVTDDIASGATITLSATTVRAGTPIAFAIAGAPGNVMDWVGLYAAATADDRGNYLQWQFLNGAQSPPSTGRTSASLAFIAPASAGTYSIRFFANGGYIRLATSATITVVP